MYEGIYFCKILLPIEGVLLYLQLTSETAVKGGEKMLDHAFQRRLILYGFVYDIDYSDLREYNATLGKISGNLNQIAKRMNVNYILVGERHIMRIKRKIHRYRIRKTIASGSLMIFIFLFFMAIKLSFLHLGQYNGKFIKILSSLIRSRVLLPHTGQ